MKLILTSDGLTTEKIKKVVLENSKINFKIAIIATETDNPEYKIYTDKIQTNFLNLGFSNMKIFDLEKMLNKSQNIKELDDYDIFYICGGNTFKILHFAKAVYLKRYIKKLFKRNGLYIGVSAGSMLAGPSIKPLMEADPEPNDVNLKNYNAFSFVNYYIFPHYNKKNHEHNILRTEKKYNIKITRLYNTDALFFSKNTKKII